MPRILTVTTVSSTINAFLKPHLKYLFESGYDLSLAASFTDEDYAALGQHYNVLDVSFDRSLFSYKNILAFCKIRKIIKSENYDIVHVHTPIASFLTRLSYFTILKPKSSVVYTVHGYHFSKNFKKFSDWLYFVMEWFVGRATDVSVVMNMDDYKIATKYKICKGQVVHLNGIGLDIDYYEKATDLSMLYKKEFNINSGCFVFIIVAELNKNKSQELALLALSQLIKKYRINTKLLIVGTGPEKNNLKSLACELEILEYVEFLGYRGDVPSLLKFADCLMLISKREGLPRCIQEAMVCRLPVIGTDIRGIRDLLEDGRGMVVKYGSISELETAMYNMIFQVDARYIMTELSYDYASKFDVSILKKRVEDIYKTIL